MNMQGSEEEMRKWMKPISLDPIDKNGNQKECFVMPSRGLKLIGIRFYPCLDNDRESVKKAMNIQKNLYGHDWLYFNKGFTIVEDKDSNPNFPTISQIEVEENAFDSSFLLYTEAAGINVGFSAIIGQNGTGKSTIVDTVIRLVNNLSAAIIGEDYVYSSAQHLHYIDNVYAALAVYVDTKVKILTCLGKVLYVTTYETEVHQLADIYNGERLNGKVVEIYKLGVTTIVLGGNEPSEELLPAQDGLHHVLTDWFYTLVANYSLYAYNYRDYISERTNDAKLSILRKISPKDNKPEDEYWLKGVFHKNDGYQMPVVIHPMRNNGYVNAANVNYLGKHNLISLAFVKAKNSHDFPFRVINNTHHIVAFYFDRLETENYKGAVEGIMNEKFVLDEDQKELFRSLVDPIRDFWAKTIGAEYKEIKQGTPEQRAWDYLIYKTIKIFWNYKHYSKAWESLNGENSQAELSTHLTELIKDSSHRTQKLRQVLAYLRFCKEEEYYMNKDVVVDLDSIYAWMTTKIGSQLYPGVDYHPITIEDLLPPPYPIINVILQLVDNEHFDEYRELGNKSLHIIPFEGLSAGERQIAYTLGNIVYHLKNIESAKQDFNNETNHLQSLKYSYVNVMLDEVELYFHPDLQRRFVCLLVDAIKGLNMESTSGINVTLITHSPFVLSDIPDENILCLSRSKDDLLEGKTFAANIHDLFNNTFFLPYTVGELAKREIERIVGFYNRWQADLHATNGWHITKEAYEEIVERDWARMRYVASSVGDEYLREELNDMLDEYAEWHERRIGHEEN